MALTDPAPSSRREARGPRPKRRRWPLILLASILGVVLVAAGLVWWNVQSRLDQIEKIDNAFPEESLRPEEAQADANGQKPMNILLLGSDSRSNQSDSLLTDLGNRADTILVAHIPADRQSVQIMSIMRDSWVEVPGKGEYKVNAALALGGVSLMVQTVETIIDQRIDHVAIIDFNGFKQVTEALGGVTVNNPVEFTSSPPGNHHYAAGPIVLEGDRALMFVRERYVFEDGDYQRVANQQLFLKAIMSQILSRGTLTDPGKLNNLLTAVTPHVATDPGLDMGTMISLAQSMTSVRGDDITSFTMPTNGTGMMGDQSVVLVNWDEVNVMREHFKNDTLKGYTPAAKP